MSSRASGQDSPDPYGTSFGTASLLHSPTSPVGRGHPAGVSESQAPGSQRTSPHSITTPSSKATHICDQCQRAFSRAEHLERHQTTHLPSTATKSFVCSACSKGFTRKDVLTRHIRAVHETKKSEVRKSRRKSCRRCAAFKIKCTGGGKGKVSGEKAAEPCEACRKREVECIFDFGAMVDKQDGLENENDNGEDLFEFGSDNDRSDPETGSSGYSVKRRKTAHYSGPSGAGSSSTSFLSSVSIQTSASAVSPHLLSAARLASVQTIKVERQQPDLSPQLTPAGDLHPNLELSSADHLLSMATFANKGMHVPNPAASGFWETPSRTPSRPSPMGQGSGQSGYSGDLMSHLYFPPIRSPGAQSQRQESGSSGKGCNSGILNRIAEEDLNAANTLQGINPAPSRSGAGSLAMSYPGHLEPWKNSIVDDSSVRTGVNIRPLDMAGVLRGNFNTDYSNVNHNGFSKSPIFGGISLAPLHQTNNSSTTGQNAAQGGSGGGSGGPGSSGVDHGDSGAMDTGMDLHEEDNFYFDFGIFDNSTDWLRDWGPNDSISPESQPGLETIERLPDSAFTLGMTPGNCNASNESAPGITQAISSTRDQPPTPPPPPSASTPSPSRDSPPRSSENPPHLQQQPGEDGSSMHVPGLPAVSPMKDHANTTDFLPWGWQHGMRQETIASRKVTLPPLRQVLTDRPGEQLLQHGEQHPGSEPAAASTEEGLITDKMRREMIHVLMLPSVQPPYPGCDSSELERAFPNKDFIAAFITLYWEHFHPILPVIHRPSFCIERSPSILLIAMVSIGASYSNLKNAKSFADGLSELCKRCLAWMAENDPAYGRSPFFLTSMCLQNLYAMGSGSTSLYDAADVSRSVIIGNARRIGLFSGTINSTPTSSSPSSTPGSPTIRPSNGRFTPNNERTQAQDRLNASSLEARWREWREKEGMKRLAWGIFEYDSSFSTLSNRRGAITISDITIGIPCSELLWEAPTATAWEALLAHEPDVRKLLFYRTLKGIISGEFDAKILTSWGKRLCAQAMGRIMWDFKELEESVLSVSPIGAAYFKPHKEILLQCMMRVCESSTPRAGEAEGDRYHWILSRLIAHYTHLHAAFRTISTMLNLARKPPPPGAETSDPRIKQLKKSFASDPTGARTLAWHAAQIIALSRWKPVFSPVEGMRLFLAGVVLWGFAQYHRSRDDSTPSSSAASSMKSGVYPLHGPEDSVRLDLLPWNMPPGMVRAYPEEWIRYGRGRATIGVEGDGEDKMMEVCGQDGAKEVLRVVVGILGSLRVWGLGGEFKNVLEELMARKS